MEKISTLTWHAHEYENKEQGTDWYWAFGIVALTGAIVAVVSGNILFAILIILGSLTLAFYTARVPNIIPIEINERGISIDKTLHPHNTLESFWIVDDERYITPHLFITSDKFFLPTMTVLLEDTQPETVREYLSNYLDEEEYNEPFPYKVMEYLGF